MHMQHTQVKSVSGGKLLNCLKHVQIHTYQNPPANRILPCTFSVCVKHHFKRQKQFYHREAPTKPTDSFWIAVVRESIPIAHNSYQVLDKFKILPISSFPLNKAILKNKTHHHKVPFSPKAISIYVLTWGKSPFFGKKSVGSTDA